ncbi:MAG: hypothetical protein DRP59_08955 [Spirochaetes bacterium]|nr:MAG: hypothetical protein DRP59_08955 [Spirochaetota bacterium]
MKPETREKILDIFRKQSGYARIRDIQNRSIHNKYLRELQDDGTIIKIKNGLYSLSETSQYNSLKEAQLAIPEGIICLGTALSHYELTTGTLRRFILQSGESKE